MNNMTAEEIMVPLDSYPHIPYWFTIRQAMVEMEKGQIESGGRQSIPRVVLVFDEQYQLMGIVRRRDIFRGLEPDYLEHTTAGRMSDKKSDFAELSTVEDIESLRRRSEKPVSEVMQPIKATVKASDSLYLVANHMVTYDLSVIPIIKGDRVIGVVRSVDVFHHIAKAIL